MTKRGNDGVIYNVRTLRNIAVWNHNGITVRSLGTRPGEKTVFFHFTQGGSQREMESVYISSVEAFLNGYDVAYISGLALSSAVEKAAEDTFRGSLYSFLPKGLESVSSSTLSRSLVTGGGAMSIVENDSLYSFEALLGVTYLASSLSAATVMCSLSGRRLPVFVDSALNEGKSVCVLKAALSSHPLRELVRDGAEAVDTFSSFLSSPVFISYPKKNGCYGISSSRWDIMRVRNQ